MPALVPDRRQLPAQAPMRILLLTTGLKLGGAEQQVAALAGAFRALGHEVAVLSLVPGKEVELPAGLAIRQLDMHKTPLSIARALCGARTFVKNWRPDVIHAHMVHANLFARVLGLLCGNVPVFCSAHSAHEGGRLRMLAYRFTDRLATCTTHVSEAGRQAMIAAGAAPAARISVMPNGIDTERFRPDAHAGLAARASLGIPAGLPLVLNVGRLVPEKSQEVLIEAFAQMKSEPSLSPTLRRARLLIAGEGPERAHLLDTVHRLGLQDDVILPGARKDIPALLNAADVFVLSSTIEGMPLALAEAMACGCPVVSTDAAGTRELTGDSGAIVRIGDSAALAAAIQAALTAGRGSLQQQATRRQRILAGFGLEQIARRWLALYAKAKHPALANCTEAT